MSEKNERTIFSPYSNHKGKYNLAALHTSDEKLQNEDLDKDEELALYLPAKAIGWAVDWLANMPDFAQEFQDKNTVVLYNLKGAEYFYQKLQAYFPQVEGRAIRFTTSTGYQTFGDINQKDLQWVDSGSLKDKKVIVLEDMNDSGTTLEAIKNLALQEGAREVKTVALYDKLVPNKKHQLTIALLQLMNLFYVGTGLDEGNNRLRNMENLAVLSKTSSSQQQAA